MAHTLNGEPIRRVKCTYKDCIKTFASWKEMHRHKIEAPEHNYCKKCDVDCGEWEEFTQHKVEAMMPFLEGAMKDSDAQPKHICCEFCGQDFKSFGGRKAHRKQNHKADQSITCPGCSRIFVRASMMVGHIERGQCPTITYRDFVGHVRHKFILKAVMKAPDAFAQNLQINNAFAPGPENPGLITEGSVAEESEVGTTTETETETDGGVTLMDQQDAAQKGGHKPLQAEVDLIKVEPRKQLTRENLQSWPRLPRNPDHRRRDVADYLSEVQLGSPPPSSRESVAGSSMSASQYASEITSRRGGNKMQTDSHRGINTPPPVASSAASSCSDAHEYGEDDATSIASASTARPETVLQRPAAWTTKNTTATLFPTAKIPPPATAEEILAREDAQAITHPNLFTARFWDPCSADYDSERFFHSVLQKYCCPFPDCVAKPVDDAYSLERHLLKSHARMKFRCAACMRVYRNCEALVAHCETGGNCGIQNHLDFFKMLDEMTGGFIKAKPLQEPVIYRPGMALTKAGKPVMNGMMQTLFKAKMPHER